MGLRITWISAVGFKDLDRGCFLGGFGMFSALDVKMNYQ